MVLYEIRCEIECLNFQAKDAEEAEELFRESISDEYGVYSAIKNNYVEIRLSKQKTL